MATKEDNKAKAADKAQADAAKDAAKAAKDSFAAPVTAKTILNDGGTQIEGKIVTGRKSRLSAKEQGQLARGEIDEAGDPTGKPIQAKRSVLKNNVLVSKPTETLYKGMLTLSGIAAATGEPVSVRCEQAEPTTEDGLFYHAQQYHPSIKRDGFKIDPTNRDDPTLRTHLE